jgi:hypothetical protein
MPTISRRQNAEQNPTAPRLALSLAEFAAAANLSLSTLEKLRKRGEGPLEFAVGTGVRIGLESARAWIRERERTRLRDVLDDPVATPEQKAAAERALRQRRTIAEDEAAR